MTIITNRADTDGIITIDHIKCSGCGICVEVCKDISLKIEGGKVTINDEPIFGCIGCGHCVAVCPNNAIMVEGRALSVKDYVQAPKKSQAISYDQLYSIMLTRRSVRDFQEKEIKQDIIEKILELSVTAPMGIPPSSVEVMVLNGKTKVREFSFDFIDYIKKYKRFITPTTISLLRPFIGKENYEAFRTFIIPALDFFIKRKEMEENWLLYDAPLAMYFYAAFTDPADPYIAATYAMLAAESLGLGSCMIGSINPFLRYGGQSIKNKYHIDPKVREGIFVIFGYPKYSYKKAIKRTFKGVKVV